MSGMGLNIIAKYFHHIHRLLFVGCISFSSTPKKIALFSLAKINKTHVRVLKGDHMNRSHVDQTKKTNDSLTIKQY